MHTLLCYRISSCHSHSHSSSRSCALTQHCPASHTNVYPSHNTSMCRTLTSNTSRFGYRWVDNTSVSALHMNRPDTKGQQRHAMFSPKTRPDVEVEFLNRVDHLIAVHQMDRLSGFLQGTSPEQHHYDADPTHDSFMANLHEASSVRDREAAKDTLAKL